jgi:cell division protein FtsL
MRIEKYLGWIIFLVILAVFHLYIYTKNVGVNYEIEALKETFNKLYSENHYLASEISALSRLDRIEGVAKNKLNMFYPEKVNYLIVTQESDAKTGQSTL